MAIETPLVVRQRFAADPHRPVYHFLPPSNWMNDPNGFIQWNGKYHLFYQHNPFGALWGNMHWGHTVSDDLIYWTDLPIGLIPTQGSPDEAGCFSGCAVNNNGVPTFIYTGTRGEKHQIQTQCVATSDDTLITWEKFPGNPVLSIVPPESGQTSDFRDPFVWKEADAWYMVVASRIKDVGGAIFLYKSNDLINWQYLHPLLIGDGSKTGSIWECPNFFKLGDQWVLILSSHVTVATDTVLYFVGSYTNHQFTPIHQGVLDYGQLYAPLTMLDDQKRRVLIGWLRESRSNERQEKAGWSGVQSIPRELSLDSKNRLVMSPIPALNTIRGKQYHCTAANIPENNVLEVAGLNLDIAAYFAPNIAQTCGISIACSSDGQERLDISYDSAKGQLVISDISSVEDACLSLSESHRVVGKTFNLNETISHSGTQADGRNLSVLTHAIPHELESGEALHLRILLDGSVVEIIANGRTSLTHRIYPSSIDRRNVRLLGAKSLVQSLDVWEMPSIWQLSQS